MKPYRSSRCTLWVSVLLICALVVPSLPAATVQAAPPSSDGSRLRTAAPLLAPTQVAAPEVAHLPPRLAAGGPDAGGYRFVDSTEPGGPTYQWDDISATGTDLASSGSDYDDHCFGPISTGFTFPFYSATYTQTYVSSNGYIGFDSTCKKVLNGPPPTAAAPNAIILALSGDMYVSAQTQHSCHQGQLS